MSKREIYSQIILKNNIMSNKKIYFDHSATTSLDKEVLAEMLPYLTEKFGNPSSLHFFGQEAVLGVDKAREQTADFLHCRSEEIVFTSGATEADNLALRGVANAARKRGIAHPHIITSQIEHDAILETARELMKEGVEVDFVGVDKHALVNVQEIISKIKDNTVLVSIMYANSEVGSIQPVREIAKKIRKLNEKREEDWKKIGPKGGERPQRIYFHTDATQAVNFVNCDVEWNYFDLLSLSGHKIYGPKGVGALYVGKKVSLNALQFGGHHENNKRSGTLNVPGIVGLGAALQRITKTAQEKNNRHIAGLRDRLVKGLQKNIPDIILNTYREQATPAHAHFIFPRVEGESILMLLDFAGIAVSTGSACASTSLEASHVLLAMGIPKDIAHSSIRFTLGKRNTKEDIDYVIKVFPPIIEKLRKISPLK
jgi:cysteine desulfurase